MAHLLQFKSKAKRARLPGGHPRTFARVCTPLVMALSLAACVSHPTPKTARSGAAPDATRSHAPRTVVSLTFDDGAASQAATLSMLWQRGMTGTYYINSAMVGSSSYYMTWSQIHALFNAGNEIGGHTSHHVNLLDPKLTPDQKQREVCDDRQRLAAQGFNPVSFAYPYGAHDRAAGTIVRSCGYQSARSAGSVSPNGPTYAETIPPHHPYATRALDSGEGGSRGPLQLSYLTNAVTAAATRGGGWVQVVFHLVCSPSDPSYRACMADSGAIDTTTMNSFLDWLRSSAPSGIAVKTVRQVLGAE